MKKILSTIILSSLLAFPVIGLALEPTPEGEVAPTVVKTGAEAIVLITGIGNWIFIFLIAVAGIFLIVAGFHWITAAGNPEGITKARTMLINSMIGIVVALLAKGIVQVIKTIIGGTSP